MHLSLLLLLLGGLLLLLGLLRSRGALGDKHGVDVGEDTTLSDGHTAEQLVQLLVVANRQLDVARHDAGLLVVTGSVASELKNLSSEVLEDGGEVDRSTSTHASGVLALLQVTRDSADRELQTRLGGLGLRLLALSLAAATLAALASTYRCSLCLGLLRGHDLVDKVGLRNESIVFWLIMARRWLGWPEGGQRAGN